MRRSIRATRVGRYSIEKGTSSASSRHCSTRPTTTSSRASVSPYRSLSPVVPPASRPTSHSRTSHGADNLARSSRRPAAARGTPRGRHTKPGQSRPDGAAPVRGQEGHRRSGSPARTADRRAPRAGPHPRRGRPGPRPARLGPRTDNQTTGAFGRTLGPVFANVLLADEINRAPAKVQSALLEVMQERQVHNGGESYPLPELFVVLATQNPLEHEGTYPLPEAQVDRFLFKLLVG